MSDQQKTTKVAFEAQDNGISSFMKKFTADSKQLYSELSKEAAKQTASQKEQLKIIEAQIKALDRQNKLEKEQNRIILDRKRSTGQISDAGYAASLAQLKDDSNVNKIQTSILKDILQESKESKKDSGGGGGPSVFNAVVLAGALRDVMGLVRQLPSAQTGLDFISPAAQITGGAAGGALGALVGSSAAGVEIGKMLGGLSGDAYTRHIRTADSYNRSYLGYRALGGNDISTKMGSMGFDDPTVAGAMLSSTRASGTGRGAGGNAALMLMLSRLGFADEGSSLAAFGMQRSGGGSGSINMQRGLGIAIAEGLDRAKFSDVIKTQTQLMQHFALTSTNVNSMDANRAIFEFNRMGGQFSAGDPRAMGNIMGISSGLATPGSAYGQAQNYAVLRRLNPNANPWELKTMEEQGLQTPGFLRGVMDQITSTGVSEPLQKFMLKGRFGNLSNAAIDTLFANKGQLGSMSEKQLSAMMETGSIRAGAQGATSPLSRMEAEVTNAFKDGAINGVKEVAAQFKEQMDIAISQVADHYKQEMGLMNTNNDDVFDRNARIINRGWGADLFDVLTGKKPLKTGATFPKIKH